METEKRRSASRHRRIRQPRLALSLSLAIAATLAGCVAAQPGPNPTSLPTPTSASPGELTDSLPSPSDITPTRSPLTEATPAIVIEPSEPIPTPTKAPPAVGVPDEELSLLSPGPGSMVRSPIRVKGYGGPSKDNRVELWLLGEDGRTITKRYTWIYSYPGRPGKFFADIPFEIPLVAEMGWLQVRSYGERFGMLRHLASVPLTLLSEGRPLIYPALRGGERIAIFGPREEAIVEGGRLLLRGAGWLETAGAFSIEILDLHGKVIASGEVEVQSGGPGELGPFEAEIPYDIPYAQWARVGVGERLAGVPGWNHYSSVLVWLRP